ncbi:MAG: hypothetical protein WCS11_01425, partial [Dysgonamonadaceae bacterium]
KKANTALLSFLKQLSRLGETKASARAEQALSLPFSYQRLKKQVVFFRTLTYSLTSLLTLYATSDRDQN